MKKAYIFGAGVDGKRLLTGDLLKDYDVICYLDNNQDKWNTKIGKYVVNSPKNLIDGDYDSVIISLKSTYSIVRFLLELGVPKEKIEIFDVNRNVIHSLLHVYTDYLDSRLFYASAVRTVQQGLLYECLLAKEFDGYMRIVVVGESNEFETVNEFFTCIDYPATILQYEKNRKYSEQDKFLFVSENYPEDLKALKEDVIMNDKQWVILPLFDVKNTIG